ncbi:zinc finger protein OZF-like isoform X2 [Wyeomyia smithii]|uniref:zinc finger protein OZF-like isoform X2 n=1 Tax=Wyeomyia smithii TaxID=174621 RepID=UPI00246801E4|nr:zinc finger protein OZF-like isoform X2 [Wyeomyia smithii]
MTVYRVMHVRDALMKHLTHIYSLTNVADLTQSCEQLKHTTDETPSKTIDYDTKENANQAYKTSENIEFHSKSIIDPSMQSTLVEPNRSAGSDACVTNEVEPVIFDPAITTKPHHLSNDDITCEIRTDVKLELMQHSDEEDDGFFVEYLDDDFRTDVLGDESISEDHLLEFNQDKQAIEPSASTINTELKKVFICCGTRCRAVMDTEQQLADHTVQVHLPHRESTCQAKPFECNRCYARFQSEKSLSLHTRKSSHCPVCLAVCFSQSEKRLHMHQVHGHISSTKMVKTSEKICCGCYKSFANEADLRAHSLEQHEIRKNAVDESRPLQCDICFKLFRTLESLRIHQRFVYRPKNFVCSTCNRAFDTRSKLVNHSLVHSEQRSYQCDKCDKAFKKAVDLKSHQLLHNEKQEECTICGLRFHRKSNLKMHMRKHKNTFFYACPDCPKQFKNNSHLKEHYKVHTKQKPYNCRFCERRFAYCSDRKRHEMTHTGDYPFECQCLKKFARKTTYDKHVSVCLERAENSM